jgi:hypothetical protein
LLGGVDLPALVGTAGPPGVGRGASAGRCRAEVGLVEPALQGPFARQGGPGVKVLQDHAQEPRSPTGVLAAQVQDFVAEGVGRGRAAAPAGGIVRGEVIAAVLQALAEAAHGA